MNGAWSARWSREEADEFLFLVGDLWLIVDREELLGDNAQQNKVATIKDVNEITCQCMQAPTCPTKIFTSNWFG